MSVNQSDCCLYCSLVLFAGALRLRHPRLHTTQLARVPSGVGEGENEENEEENELPQSGLHSFRSHVGAFGRGLRV